MSIRVNRSVESRGWLLVMTASLALGSLAACVAQKPLNQSECPCVSGWVCDQTSNTCVPIGAPGMGGSGAGGSGAGGSGAGGSGDASVGEANIIGSEIIGIWAGSVTLSAPGFAGGPLDTMRIVIGSDGRLSYFDFQNFLRAQQFGDTTAEFPLEGTRDTFGPSGGCPSAACGFHVTVQQSIFSGDSFTLQYRASGTQVLPPQSTDFVETIQGTLDGDHLVVNYSMTGMFGEPANVTASGRLPRQ